MSRKGTTSDQIYQSLRRVEELKRTGISALEACRKCKVTYSRYLLWVKQYGGLSKEGLALLKEVRTDNTYLSKHLRQVPRKQFLLNELATHHHKHALDIKAALSRRGNENRLFVALNQSRQLHRQRYELFIFMLEFTNGRRKFEDTVEELKGSLTKRDLKVIWDNIHNPVRAYRSRALSVLFDSYGIPHIYIADFLRCYVKSVRRYVKRYYSLGIESIYQQNRSMVRKFDNPDYRKAITKLIHTPPSQFGINRTKWNIPDLQAQLKDQGFPIGKNYLSRIIKSLGYRYVRAKEVITSNDPNFQEKLDNIHRILSSLRKDERFFSIDEYGPFAVKHKGGRVLVPKGVKPVVLQHQKSKGFLIVTAALELSTNQITHFYSRKKDTEEMLILLDILLKEYKKCRKLYLSWDAASWHESKKLLSRIKECNSRSYRKKHGTPLVEIAPLPARAQYLNVIESVFSGLATGVIHNSNYPSLEAAKAAIDGYWKERNDFFKRNPKRAGNKIWGSERTPSRFSDSQICKDPRYNRTNRK